MHASRHSGCRSRDACGRIGAEATARLGTEPLPERVRTCPLEDSVPRARAEEGWLYKVGSSIFGVLVYFSGF